MFNWFKGKENLLTKDVNKGMLTSNFVSFKVGEKLIVPENVVCFIRYKDKTYKELSKGEYSLNKEFLLNLYTKQLKGKNKIKNLKADLYFVNLKTFSFEFEYVDKLPLNKVKEKFLFNVKMSLQVEDFKLFAKTLIYENTAPTADTTKNILLNYAETFIKTYFLKQKLTSEQISLEQQKAINVLLVNKFKKIGINATDTEISIFKKTNKTSKQEKDFNNITETDNKKAINSTSGLVDTTTENNYTTNSNICPNCKNKLIKNSIFCHVCGYKNKI